MLWQRILTALILVPLVFGAVLYLPAGWFSLALGMVLLMAGHEWSRLAGFDDLLSKSLFIVLVGAVMLLVHGTLGEEALLWIAGGGACLWIWIGSLIVTGRQSRLVPGSRIGRGILGLITLLPLWASIISLRQFDQDGPWLLLFLLTLIWVADSAAYFVGRRWGRIKLAPAISPGKSREGVYGAIAGSTLWSGLLFVFRPDIGSLISIVILCVAVCLISVVGDLFESTQKRHAGLKDSGAILPGHGGVLDRIDSLIAAAPLFVTGLWLLRWVG